MMPRRSVKSVREVLKKRRDRQTFDGREKSFVLTVKEEVNAYRKRVS